MPQTPRFCPGCTQRKLQMNANPCEFCGRVNAVTAPKPREKMHLSAKILRALLRPLGRFFHFFTALFCVFALWSMALHGITPFFGIVMNGLLLSGLMVFGTYALRLATRAAVYLFAPATRNVKRPGGRSFLVLPVCLAVLWSLNRFDVPLRAGFWLSRAGLERMVAVHLPGTPAPRSVRLVPTLRAGNYRARQIDVSRRAARIEVTDNAFLGGTKAGFARCPQGCGAAKFPETWADWNRPPTYQKLAGDWFWWEQEGSDF